MSIFCIINYLFYLGKELLVSSKGYVCRLCNCFLNDEQGVGIHCQTAAHYINYTTMTKMKEATSGGKKRRIDQVDDDVKKVESEKVVSPDTEIIKEVCSIYCNFVIMCNNHLMYFYYL